MNKYLRALSYVSLIFITACTTKPAQNVELEYLHPQELGVESSNIHKISADDAKKYGSIYIYREIYGSEISQFLININDELVGVAKGIETGYFKFYLSPGVHEIKIQAGDRLIKHKISVKEMENYHFDTRVSFNEFILSENEATTLKRIQSLVLLPALKQVVSSGKTNPLERREWFLARQSNTWSGFGTYIAKNPGSRFVPEAIKLRLEREKIDSLNLERAINEESIEGIIQFANFGKETKFYNESLKQAVKLANKKQKAIPFFASLKMKHPSAYEYYSPSIRHNLIGPEGQKLYQIAASFLSGKPERQIIINIENSNTRWDGLEALRYLELQSMGLTPGIIDALVSMNRYVDEQRRIEKDRLKLVAELERERRRRDEELARIEEKHESKLREAKKSKSSSGESDFVKGMRVISAIAVGTAAGHYGKKQGLSQNQIDSNMRNSARPFLTEEENRNIDQNKQRSYSKVDAIFSESHRKIQAQMEKLNEQKRANERRRKFANIDGSARSENDQQRLSGQQPSSKYSVNQPSNTQSDEKLDLAVASMDAQIAEMRSTGDYAAADQAQSSVDKIKNSGANPSRYAGKIKANYFKGRSNYLHQCDMNEVQLNIMCSNANMLYIQYLKSVEDGFANADKNWYNHKKAADLTIKFYERAKIKPVAKNRPYVSTPAPSQAPITSEGKSSSVLKCAGSKYCGFDK